jgi:cell division protein ZapB
MGNLLRCHLDAMISEFHLLSEKISRLAALTQALRQENAEFRLQITALTETNAQLNGKIDTAAERVGHLLQQFPAIATNDAVDNDTVTEEEAV